MRIAWCKNSSRAKNWKDHKSRETCKIHKNPIPKASSKRSVVSILRTWFFQNRHPCAIVKNFRKSSKPSKSPRFSKGFAKGRNKFYLAVHKARGTNLATVTFTKIISKMCSIITKTKAICTFWLRKDFRASIFLENRTPITRLINIII